MSLMERLAKVDEQRLVDEHRTRGHATPVEACPSCREDARRRPIWARNMRAKELTR